MPTRFNSVKYMLSIFKRSVYVQYYLRNDYSFVPLVFYLDQRMNPVVQKTLYYSNFVRSVLDLILTDFGR